MPELSQRLQFINSVRAPADDVVTVRTLWGVGTTQLLRARDNAVIIGPTERFRYVLDDMKLRATRLTLAEGEQLENGHTFMRVDSRDDTGFFILSCTLGAWDDTEKTWPLRFRIVTDTARASFFNNSAVTFFTDLDATEAWAEQVAADIRLLNLNLGEDRGGQVSLTVRTRYLAALLRRDVVKVDDDFYTISQVRIERRNDAMVFDLDAIASLGDNPNV